MDDKLPMSPVPEIRPAGADPWCRLLFECGSTGRFAAAAVVAVAALLPLGISQARGSFRSSALSVDALHDVGYHNSFLLLLPFVSWFIVYYLNGLELAFTELRRTRIVTISDADYAATVDFANRRFSHWSVTMFAPVVGVMSIVVAAQGIWLARLDTWCSPTSGRWSVEAFTIIPTVFLLYHTIAALVARIAVIKGIASRFLSFGVDSDALHPDGCGGFSPLGAFALRISWAGVVIGLACLIGVLANTWILGLPMLSLPTVLIMSGYVIGLSIGFFVPLYPARKRMRELKEQTLRNLSERLRAETKSAMADLDGDHRQLQSLLKKIEALRQLYDLADRMPVYPFNTSSLATFASSVMWPIALLLLGQALERWS